MTQPHGLTNAKYVQWAKDLRSPAQPSQDTIAELAEAYRRQHFDVVAEKTAKLLGSYPASVQLWNIAGMMFLQTRRLTEAADAFHRVVALHPHSSEAWNRLGVVLQKQQKFEHAIVCFETALEFDPQNAGTLYNLGNAFRDNRAFDAALVTYRAALDVSPDFASAHNNCGNVLQKLGQFEDAIISYRSAVSLNADDIDAHYNMVRALKRIGEPEGLIAAARNVIERKPEHADARVHLANALKGLGRQNEAINVYLQALGSNADPKGQLTALRNLLVMPFGSLPLPVLGQIDSLVPMLETQETPTSQRLFMKANLLAHKGDIERSAVLYEKANSAKQAEQSGCLPDPVTWENAKAINLCTRAGRRADDEDGLSVLLLLGASCSGKSTLEGLLAPNPGVLAKYEALDYELLAQMSPESINSLDREKRIHLAQKIFYLTHGNENRTAKRLIVSTNPNSVYFLNTLFAVLENVHVVWLDRDEPSLIADIFKTDYVSGHTYATSIESIQHHLASYRDHMTKVSNAIPDRFLRITYADLLSSPQAQIDRLAVLTKQDFATVKEFDPAPIQYHRAQCAALARCLV